MSVALLLSIAVLQGLTEFLPVSSSGHLTVAAEVFGLDVHGREREALFVLLHGASLLAVFVGLAQTWRRLLAPKALPRALGIALLGSVPAGVVGVGLHRADATGLFDSPSLVAAGWLVTTALLLSTRGRNGSRDPFEGAFPTALVIGVGLAQAVAIVPGISRSGATIAAALLLGCRRREAFEMSFLLSMPAIGGALLLDAIDLGRVPDLGNRFGLLLALGVAFAVSLAALLVLRRIVERERLHWFAPYCFVLAIVTFAWVVAR